MTTEHTTVRRATPANPMPGLSEDARIPEEEKRNLPPEFGPDAVAVVEGRTFMYSDSVGDVPGGSIGGLVSADTRLLSRWVLTVNGARLLDLRAGVVDHYSAAFFLTNPELPDMPANTIGVRRLRVIHGSMEERIEVRNFSIRPVRLRVRLAVGNDFADLFEIKDTVRDRSSDIVREHAADGSRLEFRYRNGDFEARTTVQAVPPASLVDGDDLVWEVELRAHEEWACELGVPVNFSSPWVAPERREVPMVATAPRDPVTVWRLNIPQLVSDSHELNQVIRTTALDLAALRIAARAGDQEIMLPAAGLPWFLTLFGRDTLITAYQTACVGPALARGALIALAAFQGKEHNEFRDEEPGKILHEIRTGELTRLGQKPHNPYYGTADATMLWLILLSEYWRWSGDDDLVRQLRESAFAALDWIDLFGDRDGDGYVEYQTRSPQGLGNQCWRDSWDGVQFANGAIPELPIATCELQGYVYDAKLRLAELAEGPLDDPSLAGLLRDEADQLRQRFNEDFWINERGGYYAIGLDADKRPIDSMTSNMGHLLWSGIVPPQRAAIVVRQLMSDQLFSGWGVRTLATTDEGFNPIGYHLGTVWPHDNSIIVMGLTRYGYREEANRISLAMLDAAAFFHHCLPEALSGYPRGYAHFPVPYPTACEPQAWAAGAALLFVRSMLGLEARDGEVTVDPVIPREIGRITVSRLSAFGNQWDIEAIGTQGHVRLSA